MNTRIIIGSGLDPHRNLAFEEHLVEQAGVVEKGREQAILFLWQNTDTVVIGANQNPWRECNLQAMEKDHVRLTRRVTGGGAVFHDIGNLNFSFILPRDVYDVSRQGQVIIRALAKVGIRAEQSGRNDILADGRKFSGNAFLHRRNASLHHGTILIGADMSRLARYLQVDPLKLSGKGVQSVRARVVNLAELLPELTAETMKHLVAQSFSEEYGQPEAWEPVDLSASVVVPDPVEQLARRNASWEWLYGKTPSFTMNIRNRFPWGGLEIGFITRHGLVDEAVVWSDCLMAELPKRIAEQLKGAPFTNEALSGRIQACIGERMEGVRPADREELAAALSDCARWLREHPL